MITDAGNKCANAILAKADELEKMASISAHLYIQSDDKRHQNDYVNLAEKIKMLRQLHTEICGFLHAVEAEMTERLKKE